MEILSLKLLNFGIQEMSEKQEQTYLYTISAKDVVITKYWVKAHNDSEAIQKCIDGEFEDCQLESYCDDYCEDPIILSKEELKDV